MTNSDDIYTKNFTLEIDNVLSLRQATGHYAQSEKFKSKGPLGQEMEWVLRVYPRGDKAKTKNNVSVFLHLLDGNGSKEVRMDWNLAIINAKGNKVNKHEEKSCVYDLENDTNDIGWGFDSFISRSNLDDSKKNYIVDGHKLILHCEIFVKKDLQAAELTQLKEETKSLKRKLESQEAEIKRMESEYGKCKKYYQKEIEKLEIENSTMLMKLKEEEEERRSKLQSEYEQRLKNCREYIANLQEVKLSAMEKCRKEEEAKKNLEKEKLAADEKCQKEMEARKKLQGKYEKLYNHYVRDSSKFIEENDGDMNNETSGDNYAQNIYKFIDEMNNKSEEPSTNGIVEAKENEEEIITIA